MPDLTLRLGFKSDPIENRYSYDWLFDLLAEEDVHELQLGSFFEMYLLPDDYFVELRAKAGARGIHISSMFTSMREFGGFFRDEPGWEAIARRTHERMIEIGALLGARSVGGNPGAVMRDRMATKAPGLVRYVAHMKELMHFAHERGVPWLIMEPMSCLAEPPTLPDEVISLADELVAHHEAHPDSTSRIGYCVDVSHGYADEARRVVHDNVELFKVALPYLADVHLKNTDAIFNSTFGFDASERERGIVDVEMFRDLLLANADALPVDDVVGYFEINGPKLGRDYSDPTLERNVRDSLQFLREAFCTQ